MRARAHIYVGLTLPTSLGSDMDAGGRTIRYRRVP